MINEAISPISKYFDKTYVLNLDHHTDRMERTASILKNKGIEYERFSAIDGNRLPYNLKFVQLKDTKIKSAGAFGCLLSHIEIYKDALYRDFDKILILEDDIILHKEFDRRIPALLNKTPENWDLLYFGTTQKPGTWKSLEFINKCIYKATFSRGTFAYGISKECCQMAIDLFDFSLPIDLALNSIQDMGNSYVFFPNMIISDVTESYTQKGREMSTFCKKVKWNAEMYDIANKQNDK